MQNPTSSRRQFLNKTVLTGGAMLGASSLFHAGAAIHAADADKKPLHVACNQYPWLVYYRRENRNFNADLDAGLKEVAGCGINGFEPLVGSAAQIHSMAPLLKKHKLAMRSLYVNTTLHNPKDVEKSMAHVLAIAKAARQTMGTRIIVTNPNPLRWGGADDKNDAQLRCQAAALNKLGGALKEMGLVLSYHNHDAELRMAAREFHHMMVGTDPDKVTLCLDAHWIYRGAGNSAVAVFDVLKLYGKRITELHLRQSQKGTWSEWLGAGDIDYPSMAAHLRKIGLKPHIVLEQAVEQGTPKTMSIPDAFQKSVKYTRQVFGSFA